MPSIGCVVGFPRLLVVNTSLFQRHLQVTVCELCLYLYNFCIKDVCTGFESDESLYTGVVFHGV